MNTWLASRTHLPIIGPWLGEPAVALVASWAGFVYDLTIWLWLSWPRTRKVAFALVLAFHAAVGVLFNIGLFPFIMVSAATIFLSPSWPRTILRLRGWTAPPAPAPAAWTTAQRFGAAAIALYALVQIAMPLRHRLYDGNVLWTEQGMRWSWKVLVREKNGAVTFHVTLPDGRRRVVEPRRYLTDIQEREMSGQPDLILQLAHHIADEHRRAGDGEVEVRAEARVSLNGRAAADLVDPTVDLARVEDGLGPARWILPAPSTAPPTLRPLRRGRAANDLVARSSGAQ
jgi:hypothetical protein